jgi:uncharacterized protein (DUF1778 family)
MPRRSMRTAKLDVRLSPDAKQRLQTAAELAAGVRQSLEQKACLSPAHSAFGEVE